MGNGCTLEIVNFPQSCKKELKNISHEYEEGIKENFV